MPSNKHLSVVLADGCFDPLHVGHIRHLQQAATFGQVLVVNVATDDAIRAKGREPFQSAAERCETLRALKCVSATTSQPLVDLIQELEPAVLAKGIDWHGKLPELVEGACFRCDTRIYYTFDSKGTRRSSERLAYSTGRDFGDEHDRR